MTVCSAPNCRNSGGHLFPKDSAQKKKWIAFAQKREHEIGPYAVICKAHFRDDDFIQLVSVPGLPTPRKRLKPRAVPSIPTEKAKPLPPKKRQWLLERASKKHFKYETVATTAHHNEVLKNDKNKLVRVAVVAVLSDKELIGVIEKIKDKLISNAPSNAQFPSRWKRPISDQKIREGYPPFSMACLCAMAIESAPWGQASMPQILAFITKNFPCYKMDQEVWQEMVVKTIEQYTIFKKVNPIEKHKSKHTYYMFVPDKKTVISPEVYEALTDPRYDETKIDFSHAIIQADFEIVSICSESLESRVVDMDDEFDPIGIDGKNDSNDETLEITSENCVEFAENECDVDGSGLEPDVDVEWALQDDELSSDDDEESEGDSIVDSAKDDDASDLEEAVALYKCSFCKFSSTSNDVTSKHLLLEHLNGSMFWCRRCDYVTSDDFELEAHKRNGECSPAKPGSSKK